MVRRREAAGMKKSGRKRKTPRRVLRLPDPDFAKRAVLNTLGSPESKRAYEFAIDDFVAWYCSEPRLAFNKTVVLRYRIELEGRRLAPSTINLRLAAVRRLAYEAADTGLLSPELAAGVRRVKGAKRVGVRLGNWLTAEQSRTLLQAPDAQSLKGRRDRAILALLLGCGLRRSEVADLTVQHLQLREEHWVIADLIGKAAHIRTVPVPGWVKSAIDVWTTAAEIAAGRLFRCVTRRGSVWGDGITEKVIWHVVKECATKAGIARLAPHDCRRTCARLCHSAGGELEQIQFLLGHVSVETTERYLGCKQRLRGAVNDKIGLEP
jgi:site-specific recombinase XerD